MAISSTVLAWIGLVGSLLSVVVGISHIIYGFTAITFAPKGCGFYYCNAQWRQLITFAPDPFIDTFQPIIIGAIGFVFSLPAGVRPAYPASMSPPSSSIRGGLFHIVMALFGNLGYMYWFGIAVAAYNLLAGLLFIIVCIVQGPSRRPKDADEVQANTSLPGQSGVVTPQVVV